MTIPRPVRCLVFAVMMLSLAAASFAQITVGVSVRVAPPALPVYTQPVAPGPGYLWTPGYWGWNNDAGYYWVPGTWVVAPVGLLWTPGYWGFADGVYGWHRGYWGPHIGFYGGVNYGFGYGGVGFAGGEWRGRSFYYNRSVTNVTHVTTVYNKTVIVNENHVGFNGGEGGVAARPTHEEEMAEHEHHREPLASQTHHEHMASQNKQNFASANHGRPTIAATAKPGEFHGKGVVTAKSAGAPYKAPAMSPKQSRGPSTPAAKHVSTENVNHKSNPVDHHSTASNKNAAPSNQPNGNKSSTNKTNSNHATSLSPNHAQKDVHSKETHAAKTSTPPANSPHPASQPHQSAPRSSSVLKPVAQHQSAPKPATHQSSAPKATPKPGKGR
jgi:hypothetical protein